MLDVLRLAMEHGEKWEIESIEFRNLVPGSNHEAWDMENVLPKDSDGKIQPGRTPLTKLWSYRQSLNRAPSQASK